MSGGVDSSVAAALLKQRYNNVFGLMLRLWSDKGQENRCCSPDDVARARQVAAKLDIPFYVVDAKEQFKGQVVDFFIDSYARGITPNPCIECNRSIRWDFMLNHAIAMGATHMATGHYARIIKAADGYQVLRAVDRNKDQSYVLSVLTQEQLKHTLLPLGTYTKNEVRALAREFALSVADKPDSQDLCFIGKQGYREFLSNLDLDLARPGPIRNVEGTLLGEHSGLFEYTIGQRRGIGLSLPEPHYVVNKDIKTNTLTVGPKRSLGRQTFNVMGVNWVSGKMPGKSDRITVQIRYKAREVPATVTTLKGKAIKVDVSEAISDITPGQTAAFYQSEICLGGGIIQA